MRSALVVSLVCLQVGAPVSALTLAASDVSAQDSAEYPAANQERALDFKDCPGRALAEYEDGEKKVGYGCLMLEFGDRDLSARADKKEILVSPPAPSVERRRQARAERKELQELGLQYLYYDWQRVQYYDTNANTFRPLLLTSDKVKEALPFPLAGWRSLTAESWLTQLIKNVCDAQAKTWTVGDYEFEIRDITGRIGTGKQVGLRVSLKNGGKRYGALRLQIGDEKRRGEHRG